MQIYEKVLGHRRALALLGRHGTLLDSNFIAILRKNLCQLPKGACAVDVACARGTHFKKVSENSSQHLYLLICMKNNCIWNFELFFHILNTAPYDQSFQKWPFPLKIAHLWHKVRFLFFKLKKKVFTYNDFLKVGYYPRFYSSLRDKKSRNGDILKISCIFLNFAKFIL